MLVNMGIGLIMPTTTLYIHDTLNKSLVISGYVLLEFSGAMAIGNLVGGCLFDRWKTKPLMYIGGFGVIFSLLSLTFSPRWPLYSFLLGLYGLGLGILNACINSYLAFLQKLDNNIFNNGYWVANVGMGMATFLSGILFKINIRMVFGSSAILFLLALFIIKSKFVSIDDLRNSCATSTKFMLSGSRTFIYILLLSLTTIIVWACYEQWNSNISVLMTNNGISVQKYSILFTVSTIEIIILQPFIIRLFPKTFKANKSRMILGVLLFSLSYLVIVDTGNYWRFIAGITLVSLGEMLALTAIPILLNLYANDRNRGTVQAIGSLSGSVGRSIGPLLGSYLITSFNYSTSLIVFFCVHLIITLILVFFKDPHS